MMTPPPAGLLRLTGEVNDSNHLSTCPAADICLHKGRLDKAEENIRIDERRRLGDCLLPIAFLGIVGAAMIAWDSRHWLGQLAADDLVVLTKMVPSAMEDFDGLSDQF